jgi:hypothetical protein
MENIIEQNIKEAKKEVSGLEVFKNMKPEDKKNLKTFGMHFIISALIVLIVGVISYFRFRNVFAPTEIAQIQSVLGSLGQWGIIGLILSIIFYILGIVSFLHYRKKYKAGEITKNVSVIILRVLICALASAFVTANLWDVDNVAYSFYLFILAFACSYMFFQLFSWFEYKTFKKLLWFPLALIFRFFIPMMLVLLILLGAINGLFPHDSTFLTEVKNVFVADTYIDISHGGSLGGIFAYGCYKIVSDIYLLGESRPEFMLILCILATIFLLYITIKKHFIDGIPPTSFIDTLSDKEAKEQDDAVEAERNKTKEQINEELALEEKKEKELDDKFEVKTY